MSNFSKILGYMNEYSSLMNRYASLSGPPNAKYQPKRSQKIKNKKRRKKGKKKK